VRGAKAAFAREHGALQVILLDRPDLADALRAEVRAATGGQGADLVVEIIGGAVFDACLRSLAWCGRIVVVGFTSIGPSTIRSNYLLIKNISAIGLHWSDYRDRAPDMVRRAQQNIFQLWARENSNRRSRRCIRWSRRQRHYAVCVSGVCSAKSRLLLHGTVPTILRKAEMRVEKVFLCTS
jgi:NADPH2:quinone reductase